jgi:phospholipid-binding lipoprotein MlaA
MFEHLLRNYLTNRSTFPTQSIYKDIISSTANVALATRLKLFQKPTSITMITYKTTSNHRLLLSSLTMSALLAGCASSPEAVKQDDPWHGWNRGAQSFNDGVDDVVLKPLAKGYLKVTPEPVDESVTNFFSNLSDIGVTVNDLLQFKVTQSGMDASRFLINSTVGVAGFFDVAKMIDLPKHNEDFGQTLGFWGIPSGPYLVLPFMGPSSPREAVGSVGDALLNPLTYTFVFAGGGVAASAINAGAKTLDVTDTRAGLLTTEKIVDEASVDRYDFIKNSYRQRRESLVHDGNVPDDEEVQLEDADEFSVDETPSKATATAKSGSKQNNNNSPKTDDSGLPPVRHLLKLSAPDK